MLGIRAAATLRCATARAAERAGRWREGMAEEGEGGVERRG